LSANQNKERETVDEDSMAFFQGLLDNLVQFFGSERLEMVLHAERLVPALLRFLNEASWSLWDPAMRLEGPMQPTLSPHSCLCALLPIALWRSRPPISLDIGNSLSLGRLYEIWQSGQKQIIRGKC